VLEAVFVLLESLSPSRRIFIGSHSLPPSGSPYRSFTMKEAIQPMVFKEMSMKEAILQFKSSPVKIWEEATRLFMILISTINQKL
jgi:hypothetical protein